MFSELNQYYKVQVGSITFEAIVEPETLEGLWILNCDDMSIILVSECYVSRSSSRLLAYKHI